MKKKTAPAYCKVCGGYMDNPQEGKHTDLEDCIKGLLVRIKRIEEENLRLRDWEFS
jgi:hypothetical protein